MWLTLAFTSAALLGFYDAAKKQSLTGNAVLPVLLLNTLFSALFLLPMIVSAECGFGWFDGTILAASSGTLRAHGLVLLKAVIVLTSWIFGYFAMKHLPITIVGPINATRPVMVLVGAMLIFGERLNACQWTGVVLTLLSLFLLSRSSRREGVDFRHNVWILCIAVAALAAVVSGLYDKYIMARLDPVFVQGWCNLYLFGLMSVVVGILWWPRRRTTTPFHWTCSSSCWPISPISTPCTSPTPWSPSCRWSAAVRSSSLSCAAPCCSASTTSAPKLSIWPLSSSACSSSGWGRGNDDRVEARDLHAHLSVWAQTGFRSRNRRCQNKKTTHCGLSFFICGIVGPGHISCSSRLTVFAISASPGA